MREKHLKRFLAEETAIEGFCRDETIETPPLEPFRLRDEIAYYPRFYCVEDSVYGILSIIIGYLPSI